jgi:hypothetical protein
MATEERMPRAWYGIVSGANRSYFDHYRAMEDPALEPMPSEGPEFAKLSWDPIRRCGLRGGSKTGD